MDRDSAKRYVKDQLPGYLEAKGLSLTKAFHCLNPDHPDKNPSMSYDKKRNKVHCFSCRADYDTFDLIAIDQGIDTADHERVFKAAYDFYRLDVEQPDFQGPPRTDNRPPEIEPRQPEPAKTENTAEAEGEPKQDYGDFFLEANKNLGDPRAQDYLKMRGISLETAKRYGVGFMPAWTHPKTIAKGYRFDTPRLIIPTSISSYVARDIRPLDQIPEKQRGYIKSKVGSVEIFNLSALKDSRAVFVVEGEIDALSIIEAGGNALALGGSNANKLLEHLKTAPPSYPLLLSLDHDTAGEQATSELAEGLKKQGITHYAANVCGEHKDPNEALVKDPESFRENVLDYTYQPADSVKKEHLKNSCGRHMAKFLNGISDSISTPFIPTGFPTLDMWLDGGFFEGLYIIGAISSLGKTSIVLQMAEQIAEAGTDVLIFSLEMSRYELMAKGISRQTAIIATEQKLGLHHAQTTRFITMQKLRENFTKEEREVVADAVEAYSAYADRIFIYEGVGDIGVMSIRETVERHIQLTGNKPLVIIDYLQILAPYYGMRGTDKQNTDKAILELKRMTRALKLTVLAISSFNRDTYTQAVSESSFKESGAIEYGSDVLLGLQVRGMVEGSTDTKKTQNKKTIKKQSAKDDSRDMELVIIKNRNGRKNKKVGLTYYPAFNLFEDTGPVYDEN